MSNGKLVLFPREFSGDPETCVCGRVVLLRGPVEVAPRDAVCATKGTGRRQKGKGKSKDSEHTKKFEVHLLGGAACADILFMDAWGDVAEQASRIMQSGKVYRISGGKVISTTPRFSTSRLPYHMRIHPPRV